MADPSALPARFATAVATAPASGSLTWRLCEATRRILGADGSSVTMELGMGNRVTLCATDAVSGRLEDLRDVLGEGPATEAFGCGRPVVLTGGKASPRWYAFEEAVAGQTPAVVVVAVPMRLDRTVLSVLQLYRTTQGAVRAVGPHGARRGRAGRGAAPRPTPRRTTWHRAAGGPGAR